MSLRTLLQDPEVGDQGVDLLLCQVQVGHLRPGLHAGGISQPLTQVLKRLLGFLHALTER